MKHEDVKIDVFGGHLHITTKEYIPIIYYAQDAFRKGHEIDFCSLCEDFERITVTQYENGVTRKYCHTCAKKVGFK